MKSTQRFSNRVADYVKYRPGYPDAIVTDLVRASILKPGSPVADIGSGTGLLTQLFLKNGNPVCGIEPNPDMRHAGEEFLRAWPHFTSIDGTAEATTLADASVDLVTAGQAFHWFDPAAARQEFKRILRPPGWVALIWNERRTDASPFLHAYEGLLAEFSTDYAAIDHRRITDDTLREFFEGNGFSTARYPNQQIFDFDGLRGRLLSSSYAPAAGHPRHGAMLAALAEVFQRQQINGHVTFEYDTEVTTGRLF